jgi:FtsP/CotA-like multicopper oxidase with cupredoxin domain
MGGGMGGMGDGALTIDGHSYDPTRVDIATSLGGVEEWTIRNTSAMDHPFHLHVWPFQVVADSSGSAQPVAWKDTVNVPARGWARARVHFDALDGKTVYHCHILDHEDLGMMGVIEVTPSSDR